MKNEDQHMEFRDLAVKYLAGELSGPEREAFLESVHSDPEKARMLSEFSSIWNGVDQLAARQKYDLDQEWGLLASKMDFADEKGRVISLRKTFLRIAAVLVIGLAGLAGWYVAFRYTPYEQVAQESSTQEITLPDGSHITLYAGSELRYAIGDKWDERRIRLKGEAYFEVHRDTLHPFVIDAGSATVTVLGTSFNVKAYDDEQEVEVTVTSGLVSMASVKDESHQIILNPGNSGILYKAEKKLELVPDADPNAVAWKTREINFNNTPLGEVVEVLNHVYMTAIALGNPALENCPITVSFSNQELPAVLNVLTSTLDLTLDREGSTLVLQGEGCD